MSVREVARLLIGQFGGNAEPYFIEDPMFGKCPDAHSAYRGALTAGERFEIRSLPVSYTECGTVVMIFPGSGKKPGF
jgi:hypothetical protein